MRANSFVSSNFRFLFLTSRRTFSPLTTVTYFNLYSSQRTFNSFANTRKTLSTSLFQFDTRAKKKKGGKSKNEDTGDLPSEVDMNYLEEKMLKTIDYLANSLSGIRSERISPSLIENILIELPAKKELEKESDEKKKKQKAKKEKKNYVTLRSIADISILDHRSLVVHPHDQSLGKVITKGISSAEGGFTPQPHEGTGIKIPVPKMTIEFREQLEKKINKYSEESKESLRRTRREGMDQIKKIKSQISKDEAFRQEKKVKELLDKMVKVINDRTLAKIQEIKDSQ